MELIKLLEELGYTNEQATKIATKDKIYFQNDVDNITSKVKETMTKNFEKSHISKSDYDLLQSDYSNLVKEVKGNAIKSAFTKMGGNEKYYDDFLKINDDLYKIEDNNLDNVLKDKLSKSTWALSKDTPSLEDFGFSNQEPEDDYDGTIYGKDWSKI